MEEKIEDLKSEIEYFKKEKERVRRIVGRIGGVPTFHTRLFNSIFALVVFGCLIVSLLSSGALRWAMAELAIAALSVKIIYLIHNETRVNHFQLWILTSLEWRLNELAQFIKPDRNESSTS